MLKAFGQSNDSHSEKWAWVVGCTKLPDVLEQAEHKSELTLTEHTSIVGHELAGILGDCADQADQANRAGVVCLGD